MRRHAVISGLIILIGCGLVYFFASRSTGDWRQLNLTFGGYTNSAARISIHNAGPVPVMLREDFELEYVGISPAQPVPGLTNLMRLMPTGTNLVIPPSERADFLIPIPGEGQRWIAHLEFAPAGLKTKLGEHLIRRHESWATSLPPTIRGVPVHMVRQEFSK